MKIALVCSHGGHLTEILYLMEALKGHDVFFITYDNPRTKKLPFKKYLFPNFGKNPYKVLIYLPQIINILLKEKPDILISNGSEIAIPFFYIGRILGIKTIFIESYTRVNAPTITGRLVYPISDYFFVLWPEMLNKYGSKAKYVGNLFTKTKIPIKHKKNQILVITGTHYSGFERLVRVIDNIAEDLRYKIIVQIGYTSFKPQNAKYFGFLDYNTIRKIIKESKIVITHGAMSLIDGLGSGSFVLAFPRLKRFREAINDHQLIFAKKLEEDGLVKVATNEKELRESLIEIILTPKKKRSNSLLVNKRIVNILREMLGVMDENKRD